MQRKKSAILVVGMHRSGTSALTRVLSLLGSELPSDLIPPREGDNATGFWESEAIVATHDRLLSEHGLSWDDGLGIPESLFGSASAKRATNELLAILDRDFADSQSFVIKDPRLCRLLPLWLEVLERFEARPLLVLIARHPDEVAASLGKRNQMPSEAAAYLWLRHVLDMERHSRECTRSLVTYGGLLDDWRATIAKIAKDLGMDWGRNPKEAGPEITAFLDPELRHHHLIDQRGRSAEPALDQRVDLVWASYLASVAKDRSRDETFDRTADELDQAESILAPMLAATGRVVRVLRGGVESLHADHARASEVYENEIARNRQLLESFDARIIEQNRRLDDFAAERQKLVEQSHQAQEAYEAEIAKIRAVLEDADAKVYAQQRTLGEVVDERDRLIRSLDQERTDAQSRIRQLEQQIADSKSRLHRTRDDLQAATDDLETVAIDLQVSQADLEEAKAEATALEGRLLEQQDLTRRLRRRSVELEGDLHEAVRDKDWLWERWHEVKAEQEALLQSKVGRIVMWQWNRYIAVRKTLVRAKDRLTSPHREEWKPDSVRSTGPLRRLLRGLADITARLLRWVSRGLGWLYLLVLAAWERLRATLRREQPPPVRDPHRASSSSPAARPRVLLVSPYPIYPANHGGGVRLYNLIRRLGPHCDLHLLIFSTSGDDTEQRQALEPWTSSVQFHHWQPRFDPGWWHLDPPNAALFASGRAGRTIARLLADHSIDILQLEYTELGQYGLPRFARVKVVLTQHDLAFRQHQRRRRMQFHDRFPEGNAYGASYGDLLRLSRYELEVCRRADQIHVMSEHDGRALSAFLADGWERLRVVPNGVDTELYAPNPVAGPRQQVLFVGNFQNLPNVDAMEYLAAEIWPLVRQRQPEALLRVVGAHPSERITRYHGDNGIEVIGPVPDLTDYYHAHRLMVAPIRAGSGTRLKILEAFAAGLPVVSTTVGAEGIAARHDEHLLIADQPEAFADSIARLLTDESLCDRLAGEGLRLARESYDWQRSTDLLLAGWEELLTDSARSDSGQSRNRPSPTGDRSEIDTSLSTPGDPVEISIVIPTYFGGKKLERCLAAISQQRTVRSYEIVCVDSGSPASDLETIKRFAGHLIQIDASEFDHGLTRDLGARASSGAILVFLNQDAIPRDDGWLDRLTAPLFDHPSCTAVQGGILEESDPTDRFFWNSCGSRFYFTRESGRWLDRYFGIGFSTVNAAIRREVWEKHPFGRAPIMEDKLWQKQAIARGEVIREQSDAAVVHTHNYRLRSLWRRCQSEGYGWRLVGERYSLLDMTRDGLQLRVHQELLTGLFSGRVRSVAEILFPWLRPVALYWGNRWSRSVKH